MADIYSWRWSRRGLPQKKSRKPATHTRASSRLTVNNEPWTANRATACSSEAYLGSRCCSVVSYRVKVRGFVTKEDAPALDRLNEPALLLKAESNSACEFAVSTDVGGCLENVPNYHKTRGGCHAGFRCKVWSCLYPGRIEYLAWSRRGSMETCIQLKQW